MCLAAPPGTLSYRSDRLDATPERPGDRTEITNFERTTVPGTALVPSSSTRELSRAERTALVSNSATPERCANANGGETRKCSVDRSVSGQDVAIFVGRYGTIGPEQKGR
jgi:hypothetical protein